MKMQFDSYEEKIEKDKFIVDNDGAANWCLKKIREEIAEADRLKAIIIEERASLAEKEKAINEQLDHKIGYLKGLLFTYFGTVDHKKTKTQESYKLLDGSLVFKKPSVKIVRPENEDQLIEYLEQGQADMVDTVKKAKWGEFKKNLTISDDGEVVDMATGEKLDFVKTEEDPGSFDVKVG